MAREGTRSQTGNSRPRIFHTVETGPTITRKRRLNPLAPKPQTKGAAKATKKKTVGGTESTADKVKAALGVGTKSEGKKPKGVTKSKSASTGNGGVKKAVQKVKALTQRPADAKA
ncbi:unnamed protein product [Parascedosporium putredinis]|uniref:Uncharacterized protein n=1 Tax=Parascedosporium putredinis TaxID=1442378 RepID=A0A9P1H631_9PEZI|nr:unnamed protein product [Parascedosporium putredinis]CAI7999863.1 unnamed protein product [Parascedosporium putredinis]